MIGKGFCDKCRSSFEFDADDYWESPEEHVFTVVKCTHCGELNSVNWSQGNVDFNLHTATKEEIKEFYAE